MVDAIGAVLPGMLDDIPAGTRVDVRSRYLGTWSHGFEVAQKVEQGFLIRRLSDGTTLPEPLTVEEVRPERRKQGLWWA